MGAMIKTVNLNQAIRHPRRACRTSNLEIEEGDCFGFIRSQWGGQIHHHRRSCDAAPANVGRGADLPITSWVPVASDPAADRVTCRTISGRTRTWSFGVHGVLRRAYNINGSARTKIVSDVLELTDLAYKADALVTGFRAE